MVKKVNYKKCIAARSDICNIQNALEREVIYICNIQNALQTEVIYVIYKMHCREEIYLIYEMQCKLKKKEI